jgi:putative ABC transport system permease protein
MASQRIKPWISLIRLIGVIVPQRLRADWRQEWEAELRYRETQLAEWQQLDSRSRLDLIRRSLTAFWDALFLAPRRAEDEIVQDIRFALRHLLKNPAFTCVAVLSLALGIGANTAIFSLVDAVMVKMLPVRDPEQLVALDSFTQRGEQRDFSYPLFKYLRDRKSSFTGVFAASDGTSRMATKMTSSDDTEEAEVQMVSGEYFQVLGVDAFVGRLLTPEDETPGANPVAVLNYNFWQRRFAGDFSVIGQTIRVKEQPLTIIGVTPAKFFGEAVGRAPDVWAPLTMQPSLQKGQSYLESSNVSWLRIMGRLKTGANEDTANAEVNNVVWQLKNEPSDLGKSALNIAKIDVLSGAQGLTEFRTRFAKPLRILMAVVALVLVIACANVANLLLARATARQKEVAVRHAIGAGRFRLIRQFLTESLILATLGGVVGLLFAWWGSRALLILVSGDSSPIPIDVAPNLRILSFTFTVSVITALLFGLAPAWIITRPNVGSALKVTTPARPRLGLSRLLVVSQVTFSLLLLIGAGLFLKTLHNLRTISLGFQSDQLLQVRISPRSSGYKPEQYAELNKRLLERLNSTSGIRSASVAGSGFRAGSSRTCCIAVEGYTPGKDEDRQIQIVEVAPGYFSTLGLPLLMGRDFTSSEVENKPGVFPKFAIINETMARRYYGQSNPVGRRFGWGDEKVVYDTEIVGVARDANYGNLREKTKSLIYYPSEGGTLLVVRAGLDSSTLVATIRNEIKTVDKTLEPFISSVPQLRDEALVQERMLAKLSSFFGLLALLLAGIGLYGVMSYDVVRRTREIGVRMAVGARGLDVLGMILREALWLVIAGVLLGLVVALLTMKWIASLLFGLEPTDPVTLIVATVVMLAIAAFAGWLPAWRAARIDPVFALRHE